MNGLQMFKEVNKTAVRIACLFNEYLLTVEWFQIEVYLVENVINGTPIVICDESELKQDGDYYYSINFQDGDYFFGEYDNMGKGLDVLENAYNYLELCLKGGK